MSNIHANTHSLQGDNHKLHKIVQRRKNRFKKKDTANTHAHTHFLAVWVLHSVITAAVKSLEAAPGSQTAHEVVSQAAGTFTI